MFALIASVLAAIVMNTNNLEKRDREFVLFSPAMNLSDESREQLIKRLADNNIGYRMDEQGNVYIRRGDQTDAVVCCS